MKLKDIDEALGRSQGDAQKGEEKQDEHTRKREVPEKIMKLVQKWNLHAGLLRFVHVTLGVIAIISSITVASKLIPNDSNLLSPIAWVAAVSAALLIHLNLETKSNHYRTAWRTLNAAVLRFENEDNDKFTIEDLDTAYKTGEEMIGDVNINLPQ